jgi:hypothetical protein
MSPTRTLALAAVLLPLSALAQTSYSMAPRAELHVLPLDVRACVDRNETLRDRRYAIERERDAVELEADALARAGADLDAEWRSMDRTNARAVADYNLRQERHNRRVEAQNRRVAEFNGRTATLNDDTDMLVSRCAAPYLPPDRDALRDRNRVR